MAETVVLLHGLARTTLSLRRLELALRQDGYRVLNFGYPTRRLGLADLVRHVHARLDARGLADAGGSQLMHGCGHSLGGVVLRALMGAPPGGWRAGRLVTIGSPHRGTHVVAPLLRQRAAHAFFGPVLADLAWESRALRSLPSGRSGPVEVGAIAGAGGFRPLVPAAWLRARLGLHDASDGTVERDSAFGAPWWPPFTDCLEVDRGHAFIAAAPEVIAQTRQFLRQGRFRRPR